MTRASLRLLPALGLLAASCSSEPASTPPPPPPAADAGPRPLDGIGGDTPSPSDPDGYDAGTPDLPTFVPSRECCPVTFKLRYAGEAPGGMRLRGGDAPLTGAGEPMTLSPFEPDVWTATVCMPPAYASTYHYEVELPDDQAEGRTFTSILFNPYAPTAIDATLGTVNRFLPATSCEELDASLYAALSLPVCADGFTLSEGTFQCVDVDECDLGTDDCDAVATCTNTTGAFLCACPPTRPGDGRTCGCPPGEILDSGSCRAPLAGDVVTKVVGGVALEFSYIPPGTFTMGGDAADYDALPREFPAHPVTLTRGFLLLRNELTEAQFAAILGMQPPVAGGDMPVTMPFLSASSIADLVSVADNVPLGTYRLPTEAEWEYAARAGTIDSRYGPVDDIAWYLGNTGSLQPVRGKLPNAWHLYDMLGNIEEWTGDFWGDYDAQPATDPAGPPSGPFWAPENRVGRGGNYAHAASVMRAPFRFNLPYEASAGVRLARSFP